MIIKMKKIYMIVQQKYIGEALEQLRLFGAVHVEHQESIAGHHLSHLREDVTLLQRVNNALDTVKEDYCQEKCHDWRSKAEEIAKELDEIEELKEDLSKRKLVIKQWESWGNFEPADIEYLRSQGILVQFFKVPMKKNIEVPDGVPYEIIFSASKLHHCIGFSQQEVKLPYETIMLPQMSLREMKNLSDKETALIKSAQDRITYNARFRSYLSETLRQAKERLEFGEVAAGMKKHDDFAVLKGFCPAKLCQQLEGKAKKEDWALLIEEPADNDQVPTMLQNPRWVNLIKPVLSLIEVVPGYKECDVSAVFLMFFTVFFGILIGDAAYGAILLFATVAFHFTKGRTVKDKTPFFLLYTLTGVTIVWGVLTGTYFGQEWLAGSVVKPLVPWLVDEQNIQWLCFTIAVVHLTIARVWAGILKLPSITALSEVGWLLIVWGMFHLANMFVLGMQLPSYEKWFFIIGMPFAFLFMVPPKHFLKTAPIESIPFILNTIGVGTDIVSYIRLFAVGLATVAVADAANAMPDNFGPVIGTFGLVILHLLNIVLAIMAILVHAVRLNVLEFSGHLNLQWTGLKFTPFKAVEQN